VGSAEDREIFGSLENQPITNDVVMERVESLHDGLGAVLQGQLFDLFADPLDLFVDVVRLQKRQTQVLSDPVGDEVVSRIAMWS
jgi:hypothetical protein